MFRPTLMGTIAIAMVGAIAPPAARAQDEEWDDAAVAKAIEDGKAWLWSQWSDGHWKELYGQPGARKDGPSGPNHGGVTSLCLYAMLAAGERPKDPKVQQTLKWLAELTMHGVYARGMRANVWGMLGRESPYRRMLREDVGWLVNSAYYGSKKYPDGSYPYLGGEPGKGPWGQQDRSNWDNSNSQIAVLGVWAGARNGVENVPLRYWQIVEQHWLKQQKGDGGWDYAKPDRWKIKDPNRSYGAMTAAGLATLYICFDNLHREEFTRCRGNAETPHILKGLKWMEQNFSPRGNPGLRDTGVDTYYLYGVERVGLASGHKYFGKNDWYKQGARVLMNEMRLNGSVGGSTVETAFALLFLARGRHPVLFNKLRYDGIWNARPRDLANLTRWISATFESPVNWQIIHLDAPVSDWHDAPILYISGAKPPTFTDADLDKLRTYVLQGGVILSEAACGSRTFDKAIRQVYARLFPKYELKELPADHPVNTLHFNVRRGRRLEGISNGLRTLAIHSTYDLSGAWQLNRYAQAPDLFRQAANITFFVTDKGSLRSRGATPWPPARPFRPAETVRVAPVKYDGPWDVEPLALKRFALLMGRRHKVRIDLAEPTPPNALDAAKTPVAVMTGLGEIKLDARALAGLKKYLQAGGTLIADAAGSSRAFADALETQLAALLPGAAWAPLPPDHALYTRAGPAIEKVRYRRALQLPGGPARPRLKALRQSGRDAALLSEFDLTAGLVGYAQWGLKGYEPETAFALMRNAVLHAAGKTLGGAGK